MACFVQSGLKAICGTFRVVAHLEAISSAPFGEPPWIEDHVGMLGVDLVEAIPDQVVVVEVEATGECDLWPRWHHDLGLGAALGGDEVSGVDHCRGERAVVDE